MIIPLWLNQTSLYLFQETALRTESKLKSFLSSRKDLYSNRSPLTRVISCLTLMQVLLRLCSLNKLKNIWKTISQQNWSRMILITSRLKLRKRTIKMVNNQRNYSFLTVRTTNHRIKTLIRTKTITLDRMMINWKTKEKHWTKKQ